MAINIKLVLSKLVEFNNCNVDMHTIDKMKAMVNYDKNKFSNLDILINVIRKDNSDMDTSVQVVNILEGYRKVISNFESCRLKLWVYADLGYTVGKMVTSEMSTTFSKRSEDVQFGSAIVRRDVLGDILKYDNMSSTLVRE